MPIAIDECNIPRRDVQGYRQQKQGDECTDETKLIVDNTNTDKKTPDTPQKVNKHCWYLEKISHFSLLD
jgi:hypothetical protein